MVEHDAEHDAAQADAYVEGAHQRGEGEPAFVRGRPVDRQRHDRGLHHAEPDPFQDCGDQHARGGRNVGQRDHRRGQTRHAGDDDRGPPEAVGQAASQGSGNDDDQRIDREEHAGVAQIVGFGEQRQKRHDRAEGDCHADGDGRGKQRTAADPTPRTGAGRPGSALADRFMHESGEHEAAASQCRAQPEQMIVTDPPDQHDAESRTDGHRQIERHAVIAHALAAAAGRRQIGYDHPGRGGVRGDAQPVKEAQAEHDRHGFGLRVQGRGHAIDQRAEAEHRLAAPRIDEVPGQGAGQQGGHGESAHDEADLRIGPMQLLDDEDRQDGEQQEHAAGEQERRQTQQNEIAGEEDGVISSRRPWRR